MDPPVVPLLCRQRRAPSTPRPCLQPWQFYADAGDAEDRGAVVADQPAREADQDRREGRQPRPLRYVSDGRGSGTTTDVRGYPLAHCAAAVTASTSMTGRLGQIRQTTTAEMRLDQRKR